MIKCKVLSHGEAKTIEYVCDDCGRIQIRCFGKDAKKEQRKRSCWFCNKNQPIIIDLILSQDDRIQYHLLSSANRVVSGIY